MSFVSLVVFLIFIFLYVLSTLFTNHLQLKSLNERLTARLFAPRKFSSRFDGLLLSYTCLLRIAIQ